MSSESIDLDITISKTTANNLEKLLLDYKKRILKDLAENLNISYKELEQEFLIRDTTYKKRYYGPDRSQIDHTKCMARIWHSKLGAVQCSRKPFTDKTPGNVTEYEYCQTHLTENKRNYGRIDKEFKSE